jgi:hypothetical protein
MLDVDEFDVQGESVLSRAIHTYSYVRSFLCRCIWCRSKFSGVPKPMWPGRPLESAVIANGFRRAEIGGML